MDKSNQTPTLSSTLAALKSKSTAKDIANLARFAINPTKFYGVSMANLKQLAKQIGRNHELAAELWDSGWYEARMLATLIDEPARVTAAQMNRWCKAFDNWGIVDTACFCLFDRTPFTFEKIHQWSKAKGEFQKRTAFALLWSTSLHDKTSGDEPFLKCLPLIEQAATDERNFVKKGVKMALGAVARRSAVLHRACLELAERLAASDDATAKWIGKDSLRELQRVTTRKSK
jgi:3-methyladenine DNA glycosylase AlkD